MRKNHVFYFDFLRLVAIFLVVMLHVSCRVFGEVDGPWSFPWAVANAYDSLCRCAVPVFVMISGALFLDRDIPIRRLYLKYVFRIARIFVIWSVFYAFVELARDVIHHESLSVWVFCRNCLTGHFHEWFLFMIAGLYLIVPFLRKIAEDAKLCNLFLVLGFFFALLVPQAVALVCLFSPETGEALEGIVSKCRIHFFMGYSVYFMWGYWLHKHDISSTVARTCAVLGALGVVLTFLLTAIASGHAGKLDETFYRVSNVTVFLSATAVFAVCKRLLPNSKGNGRLGHIVSNLARHSIGVYLIHVFLLMVLDSVFHLSALSFHPVGAIPVTTLFAFILSLALSYLLSRIPWVGQWLF